MTLPVYLLVGLIFAVNAVLAGFCMGVGKSEWLSYVIIALLNGLLWPICQTAVLIGIIIYCKRHKPPQKVDLVFVDDDD